MSLNNDPAELLKEFYFKSLLIQQSTKMINNHWGDQVSRSISNFIFTDPFNVAIQTDPEQVEFFNKLLGTSQETIRWAVKKNSECSLDITEKNKTKIIPEILSQQYCLLSVSVFENFIILLKAFSGLEKKATSFQVINEFYDLFKNELTLLDQQKVDKRPTILLIQNLRIFRNCITHANPTMKEIEKEFDQYNLKIREGNPAYSKIISLGELPRELVYYSFDSNQSKIFLSSQSFTVLLDFYAQLAYIAYLCYCKKFGHPVTLK